MSGKGAESGWLLLSKAVAQLKDGMYGNFGRAEAVKKAKKAYPGASIGFGLQKEDAAGSIDHAIISGELSVFVLPASDACESPLQVPPDVLRKMIRIRGGLPDHAVQSMRVFAKEPIASELRQALAKSALYVRQSDFETWYKKDRKQIKWPSQRSSRKPRMGRPSRQNDLRAEIIAQANQGQWSAQQKIADLVRLLRSKGIIAERDTTRRVVDQLFKETGDQRYRRRSRKPRHTG